MKKLAIIGASNMASIFCLNAREMGIESHCFAWEEGAIAKSDADYFYPISIFEKDTIVEYCKNIGIDGVVATTELTIEVAAYVANRLHLNGNSTECAKVITDKYRNRELVSSIKELHQPRFAKILSEKDIYNLEFNYPLIIKPTSKGGKRGVQVITSKQDIHGAFLYAIQETNAKGEYIIEEYIEGGVEYSVESLSYKGEVFVIQVTEKISSGPPHCVELGHEQPARLSDDMRKKVEEVVSAAVKAIGITDGASHTEIKICGDKIYLIEINARPGGDHISYPLTHLSTGYPFIKGAIEIALDCFDGIDKTKLKKYYAGVYFVTKQTTYLKKIFDNCQKYKWCYKKNIASENLEEINHNNGYDTNYFIYFDKNKRPNFRKNDKFLREI